MPDSAFQLVTLKGGARSILSRVHGETMHIGSGPRTEAMELHILQQRLVERAKEWRRSEPFVIWDIGLGPAGNVLTSMEALREITTPIEIHSFEISTEVLEFALRHAEALEYLAGWESIVGELLEREVAFPTPSIRWQLHRGDFSDLSGTIPEIPSPSAIFFDPYSPARNPEMWSVDTFRSLWKAVSDPGAPECLMTNYTRSTSVRVTMALAGWFVGRGVPTGDKTETTIASNRIDLLENPLDHSWLDRVQASTNAAPLRGRSYRRGPIAAGEFSMLKSLPQFQAS